MNYVKFLIKVNVNGYRFVNGGAVSYDLAEEVAKNGCRV